MIDKEKLNEIILNRRNFIKLIIGAIAAIIGYYLYNLFSKTEIGAYYQISLENGKAKVYNTKKESIDYESNDHHSAIQYALNNLPSRTNKEKVSLKGDFISSNTIKIPSYTIFELEGSVILGDNVNKVLIEESNPIIGTTQIEMIGGIYDGNKNKQTITNFVINFTKITNSHFAGFIAQNAGKDCFVLDTDCNNNIIENIIGRLAGLGNLSDGNGLDDRGDHNTWKNCIAEDNFSDNWVIKCRNSKFINCIGRNSIDAVGFGFFADRDITDNQFIACEAYNNKTNGTSLNIPEKSDGKSIKIENNSFQGIFYNNQKDGLRLTDKTTDGIWRNNTFDILTYNNKEAGFEIEQKRINNNSGVIVAYNNGSYDVNIKGYSNSFNVFHPDNVKIKVEAEDNNTIDTKKISCSKSTEYWSLNKYCKN